MSIEQLNYYQAKLAYETDSADLYEAIENGEAIVVVDGRAAAAYAHEHIPGAMSLPHREISAETTASLDRSKDLRLLLRRHRVQRVDEDGVEAPARSGSRCANSSGGWTGGSGTAIQPTGPERSSRRASGAAVTDLRLPGLVYLEAQRPLTGAARPAGAG